MSVEPDVIDGLLHDVDSLVEKAVEIRLDAQEINELVLELLSDEELTDEQRAHLREVLEDSTSMVWSMNKMGAP